MSFLQFLLVALVVFSSPCYSNAFDFPQFKYPIQLSVSADNEETGILLDSYLRKELGKIKDAEIVEKSPLYKIDIIGSKIENVSGKQLGYVLSAVIIIITENNLTDETIGYLTTTGCSWDAT